MRQVVGERLPRLARRVPDLGVLGDPVPLDRRRMHHDQRHQQQRQDGRVGDVQAQQDRDVAGELGREPEAEPAERATDLQVVAERLEPF
jgi:hypothetical protein